VRARAGGAPSAPAARVPPRARGGPRRPRVLAASATGRESRALGVSGHIPVKVLSWVTASACLDVMARRAAKARLSWPGDGSSERAQVSGLNGLNGPAVASSGSPVAPSHMPIPDNTAEGCALLARAKALPTCVIQRAAPPAQGLTAKTRLACRQYIAARKRAGCKLLTAMQTKLAAASELPATVAVSPCMLSLQILRHTVKARNRATAFAYSFLSPSAQAFVSSSLRNGLQTTWECAHREAKRGGQCQAGLLGAKVAAPRTGSALCALVASMLTLSRSEVERC